MPEAGSSRYRVRYSSRQAERELHDLGAPDFRRVNAAVQDLALDPRPTDSRLVRGAHGVYRIRAGRFRIHYQVDDENREIIIGGIERRGETTYRNVDRLF